MKPTFIRPVYAALAKLGVQARNAGIWSLCLLGMVACVGGREYNPSISTHAAAKTLPIDLKGFRVQPLATAIQVQWETDTELGCAFFEVERSADDVHYETVGRIEGDAMAVTARKYDFVDTKPLSGYAYYRLRQVDLDGVTHLSLKQLVNNESSQRLMAVR